MLSLKLFWGSYKYFLMSFILVLNVGIWFYLVYGDFVSIDLTNFFPHGEFSEQDLDFTSGERNILFLLFFVVTFFLTVFFLSEFWSFISLIFFSVLTLKSIWNFYYTKNMILFLYWFVVWRKLSYEEKLTLFLEKSKELGVEPSDFDDIYYSIIHIDDPWQLDSIFEIFLTWRTEVVEVVEESLKPLEPWGQWQPVIDVITSPVVLTLIIIPVGIFLGFYFFGGSGPGNSSGSSTTNTPRNPEQVGGNETKPLGDITGGDGSNTVTNTPQGVEQGGVNTPKLSLRLTIPVEEPEPVDDDLEL